MRRLPTEFAALTSSSSTERFSPTMKWSARAFRLKPASAWVILPFPGPTVRVEALRQLNVKRRIYVHINNSNPILDENSDARKFVKAAGWEVGFDGMEVRL